MAKRATVFEERFAAEYVVDYDASAAFLRTYPNYKGKRSKERGYQCLQKPGVREILKREHEAKLARSRFDQDYVLETIHSTVERCRQAEPVRDKDGDPTGEYRFDAGNVLKGCELMGKHLGMWVDRSEVNVTGQSITFVMQLAPAVPVAQALAE